MILALLLAAAAPETAVDAERAFAADAQTEGQWTAFRQYAAPDGIMFVPEQVNAQQWLKGRADPQQAVIWWPAQAFVSCDGKTAVTTGPWTRNGGKLKGYFTTVWQRQADGRWKWLLDHGDALTSPRSASDAPEVRQATCARTLHSPWHLIRPPGELGHGASADQSLRWEWHMLPTGERRVTVRIKNGLAYETVVSDIVAPQ